MNTLNSFCSKLRTKPWCIPTYLLKALLSLSLSSMQSNSRRGSLIHWSYQWPYLTIQYSHPDILVPTKPPPETPYQTHSRNHWNSSRGLFSFSCISNHKSCNCYLRRVRHKLDWSLSSCFKYRNEGDREKDIYLFIQFYLIILFDTSTSPWRFRFGEPFPHDWRLYHNMLSFPNKLVISSLYICNSINLNSCYNRVVHGSTRTRGSSPVGSRFFRILAGRVGSGQHFGFFRCLLIVSWSTRTRGSSQVGSRFCWILAGRVGSGRVGSGQHFRFFRFFLIVSWYMNR